MIVPRRTPAGSKPLLRAYDLASMLRLIGLDHGAQWTVHGNSVTSTVTIHAPRPWWDLRRGTTLATAKIAYSPRTITVVATDPATRDLLAWARLQLEYLFDCPVSVT